MSSRAYISEVQKQIEGVTFLNESYLPLYLYDDGMKTNFKQQCYGFSFTGGDSTYTVTVDDKGLSKRFILGNIPYDVFKFMLIYFKKYYTIKKVVLISVLSREGSIKKNDEIDIDLYLEGEEHQILFAVYEPVLNFQMDLEIARQNRRRFLDVVDKVNNEISYSIVSFKSGIYTPHLYTTYNRIVVDNRDNQCPSLIISFYFDIDVLYNELKSLLVPNTLSLYQRKDTTKK
jgi:hypothetical protein